MLFHEKKMLVYFMNVPSTHVYFFRGQSAADLFDFHNPWKIENHMKKKKNNSNSFFQIKHYCYRKKECPTIGTNGHD